MKMVYPPRPAGKMRPQDLADFESNGWWGQRKFNGQHIVVKLQGNEVSIFTQDGKVPTKFSLTESMEQQLLGISGPDEMWLDGELMVARQTDPRYGDHYKNKIIFFDILFFEGKHLFRGPTFAERSEMLAKVCGNPVEHEPARGIALRVTDDVWMAETFQENLEDRFNDFQTPILEGLVLKQPLSVLDSMGGKPHEVRWMTRCRVGSTLYSF